MQAPVEPLGRVGCTGNQRRVDAKGLREPPNPVAFHGGAGSRSSRLAESLPRVKAAQSSPVPPFNVVFCFPSRKVLHPLVDVCASTVRQCNPKYSTGITPVVGPVVPGGPLRLGLAVAALLFSFCFVLGPGSPPTPPLTHLYDIHSRKLHSQCTHNDICTLGTLGYPVCLGGTHTPRSPGDAGFPVSPGDAR